MLIFLITTLLFTRFYALFNIGAVFYNFEGLYRGYMAKELLDGANFWSIFNTPYFTAEGGSVVTAYLVALSFSLFGDTFFALILVPVVFSLLILISFYLFLERYFNRYVAIIFSFLFIFQPPMFFQFSLFALGFHFEVAFFIILGAFFFFEIFINDVYYKAYIKNTPSKNLKYLFIVFGLISGFGTYFLYDYLIMLFTLITFWFLFDTRFFLRRYFYIFLLGFIIGFLPWIAYNYSHSFHGLYIFNQRPSEILFSKNPSQILKTFWFIVTYQLPYMLTKKLYLTIVFSFMIVIVLNFKSFLKLLLSLLTHDVPRLREVFFITYILISISTWSILYLPIKGPGVPLWMSGLSGRLQHIHLFLFALVAALYSNRFIPLKKKIGYRLKLVVFLAFTIWIFYIGFLNYSLLLASPDSKINPLKIKGYSIRAPLQRDKINTLSFCNLDMYRVTRALKGTWPQPNALILYNREGNYTHFASAINKLLELLLNDSFFVESQKPYYYLAIGLNAGDSLEGYDMYNLNGLIAQKVPSIYRHYFYEGVAISLMNRRRDEIIKNIDFIEKIPMEYRHYFLLELGRVIGSYPDDKIKQEKLQSSINRFPGIYESYIRRGLVKNLANEDYLKNQHKNNIQKEEFPYLYRASARRAIARRFFREWPSENVIFDFLKNYAIDQNNERYFYWGIVETYFKEDTVYQEDVIKNKIETIVKCNWTNKDALCEGLGLTLGHLTFGYIKRFTEPIESSFDTNQLSHFYYGYSISLKERYGMDMGRMKELIDNNVPEGFKKRCYYAIERQDS